jgi:hypothetical protein
VQAKKNNNKKNFFGGIMATPLTNPMEYKWDKDMETDIEARFPAGSTYVSEFKRNLALLRQAMSVGKITEAEKIMQRMYPPPAMDFETGLKQALFIYHVSPAIPTIFACNEIVGLLPYKAKVLEINAHRGVWSLFLDFFFCKTTALHCTRRAYSQTLGPVHRTEDPASYLQGSGRHFDVLLLVRPDRQDGMQDAVQCVNWFKGDTVIYVGCEPLGEDRKEGHVFLDIERLFVFTHHVEIPMLLDKTEMIMVYKRRHPV